MADTKFTIDASQALAQLDGVDRALGELAQSFLESAKKINSSLAGSFSVSKGIEATEKLKEEIKSIGPELTKNLNPKQAQAFAAATAKAEKAVIELDAAIDAVDPLDIASVKRYEKAIYDANRAGKELGGIRKEIEGVNKEAGIGSKTFSGLGGKIAGAAAGAAAAFSFGDAIRAGVELNAEYERVKTSLTVLLKDAEKADDLLGKLNQFAAETPFQTDEINRAATSLLAFGESEQTVIDRLREIGTLSAGTGKDFNELTSIYGKARVAGVLYAEDINQLVEAGIPIIQEFAKQLKKPEAEIKKLASEGKIGFDQLQKAFTNLTTGTGQFAGLLEAQSKTLSGTMSTLRDAFGQRLRVAFSGFSELVKAGAAGLTKFFDTTKSGSQVLEGERVALLGVANQVRLTNVGTDERTKLVTKLKDQYPQFLGQIDAEKATNEQLQPILEKINQSYIIRIALQKQQEKLRPLLEAQAEAETRLAKQRVSVNQQLALGAEISGVNLSAYKTEAEQIAAVTVALEKQARFSQGGGQFSVVVPLNEQAKILQSIRDSQIGNTVQANSQKQAQEKVNDALKEQESITEQLKKTYGEVFDIATKPAPTQPGRTTSAPGGKSATEIAFDNRAKDISRRRTLLNDLEDGLEKELEAVRLHFDQLRLEYDKAGLDTSKLAQKQAQAEAGVFSSALDKQVEADAAALEEIKRISDAYIADQTAKAEQVKALRDREIREAQERANSIIAAAQSAGVGQSELTRLQVEADRELAQRRAQAEQEYNKALADAKKATIEQQKRDRDAEIDLQEERGNQLVLIAQQAGAKEAEVNKLRLELDRATKEARLQSELEFQQALLAITDTADAEQVRSIQNRIDLLKAQIGTLKLQGVESVAGPKKKQTIYDLLGIDIETDEGQRAADAIKEIQGQVIEGLQSITAARTAAADAALAEADRLVQSKKDELDQEIALAEAGFASNVTLKRQELEEAKKQREKALDEQRKAQRAQILLDTAVQVSGLATSAANIFKSLSPLGPFGVAAAIASIGVMFAAFAKSKADALKATRARYGLSGFVDGQGIVHGRSHAQGGQHLEVERGEMIQVGDDGTRRRVEVVRRERARQYFDLLRAANEGDQKAIARHAFSLAGIDPDRVNATDAQAVIRYNIPRVQMDSLKGRLEAVTTNNTSTTIINQPDTRQAALLEAILYEMKRGRDGERWSADGRVKLKGSVRTTYIN